MFANARKMLSLVICSGSSSLFTVAARFYKRAQRTTSATPQVYEAFQKGLFTSRITDAEFSTISDDHLHEQNNKLIKGYSGAISILHNNAALLKCMVAGHKYHK